MNPFAFVALWGFWTLLVIGWWLDELHVFLLPYLALLDIALVLMIFHGDVTLR